MDIRLLHSTAVWANVHLQHTPQGTIITATHDTRLLPCMLKRLKMKHIQL